MVQQHLCCRPPEADEPSLGSNGDMDYDRGVSFFAHSGSICLDGNRCVLRFHKSNSRLRIAMHKSSVVVIFTHVPQVS